MKFCIGDEALILNGEHKGEKGIISFHYPIEKRYTINPVNAIEIVPELVSTSKWSNQSGRL